ncbi:MAG: hypothetical protein AB7H77_02225 [Bdellovibrionales bacterium]
MFLLTFVLMVIAVIATYTQVFAIEAIRLFENQTGVAKTMLIWHNAASSLAGGVINSSSFTATGCSLTPGFGASCPAGSTVTINAGGSASSVKVTNSQCAYQTNTICYPNIPVGYSPSNMYQWKSLAYKTNPTDLNGNADTSSNYVLTYVDPPTISAGNPAPGFVATASATQLNVTIPDIHRQFQKLNIPTYSFGFVSQIGGQKKLIVAPIMDTDGNLMPMSYSVPASVPTGSLAIISSPGSCTSC